MPVPQLGRLELLLPVDHLAGRIGEGPHPPPGEESAQLVMLQHGEEVAADALGVGFEEALAGNLSDPGEDLHAQVLPGDGPYHVDRVLLLLHVVGPEAEDVATPVHVNVVGDPGDVSLERLGVVDRQLLSDLDAVLELAREMGDLPALGELLLIFELLELLALGLTRGKLKGQLALLLSKVVLGPVAEGLTLDLFESILKSALEESLPRLEFLEGINPGIEASRLR